MKNALVSLSALSLALFALGCGGEDNVDEDSGTVEDTGTTGTDGGVEDTTQDTGPPPGEQLWISYTREASFPAPSLPDYVQLVVVDEDCRPDDCDSEIIVEGDDAAFSCDSGCIPSEDLRFVAFFDDATAGTLRAIALDDGFQLEGSSWIVATDVSNFKVAGSTVVYKSGTGLHAYDLASQTDTSLGAMGEVGGFDVSADGSRVFVGDVTSLTSMTINELPVAGGAATEVYHFVAGMEQGTGSFYSGNEQMALSPDGQFLAVVTDAWTGSNECGSNSDCTQDGEICLLDGSPPRCVRQELVLNIVNLNERALLNGTCSSDADCGEGHLCDTSIPGSEVCMPGRIVLGPSGPNACDRLEIGQYRGIRPQLRWRSDTEVVALMTQDCISGNIDATGIVAFDARTGAASPLVENPGESHGGEGCYDDVEARYNDELCNVEINVMEISPTHGTIAFIANSVNARTTDEVWIMDAFGRRAREMMTRSIDFDPINVWVHVR